MTTIPSTQTTACPTYGADFITDRQTTKDVLRAAVHAVLFHRMLGTVKPATMEVLDVTVPAVSDPETERHVNEKVDQFWRGIEHGSHEGKRGQISVTFSEKRPKKAWFYTGEEEVPWEIWNINVEIRQLKTDRERQNLHTTLSSSLSKLLHNVLTSTSSERGRAAVPIITNANGLSPFPFRLVVRINGIELV